MSPSAANLLPNSRNVRMYLCTKRPASITERRRLSKALADAIAVAKGEELFLSSRPAIFWNWFTGAFLVLLCLASVFIVKALQSVGQPTDVVPATMR